MADDDFYNARLNEFNCYDYAAGSKKPAKGVPGAAGGKPMLKMTAAQMHQGLVADGAIPAAFDGIPSQKKGYRIIAAAIDTNGYGDFHFYRQEPDGSWSHKFNNSAVSHVDANGIRITNPQTAARDYSKQYDGMGRNNYKLTGYYYIPENGYQTAPSDRPEPAPKSDWQRGIGSMQRLIRPGL